MRNFSTRSFFVLVILVAMFQVTVNAQQPRIRFNLPSGGFQEVCLEQAAATVDVDDSDILITADAAANDLGCPGQDPIINSLSASPSALDLTTLNCDLDGNSVDDAVCLFVSWNITPAISDTTCDIEQVEPVTKFSQTPFEFSNPSSFVNPNNPTLFTSVVNGLQWQVNLATATAGFKRFRMTCTALGGGSPVVGFFESTYIDGADPTVTIDTFNITQTTAEQGETINFSWNVTLSNGPTAPSCTLSSPGTINAVTVPVTASPGSSTATILNGSPLGTRNFTFSCRPDAVSPVTDTDSDTVAVTSNSTPCAAPIVATRDTTFTTFQAAFNGTAWPGPNGDSVNISVDNNEYMALQFTVPFTSINGNIGSVQAPFPNSAAHITSIDPCPGVLQTEDGQCDVNFPTIKSSVFWRHSTAPGGSACELIEGETYFFNIFYGDRNGTSNCSFAECVASFDNSF